jgi:hypothetical protein
MQTPFLRFVPLGHVFGTPPPLTGGFVFGAEGVGDVAVVVFPLVGVVVVDVVDESVVVEVDDVGVGVGVGVVVCPVVDVVVS